MEFEEYTVKHPISLGQTPPDWIISDWLKDALTVKTQTLFRQRIKAIHVYLEATIVTCYDKMYDEHVNQINRPLTDDQSGIRVNDA